MLTGLDVPIVNNYGVWIDEYRALGMEHTLECTFPDAVCYFGEGNEASAQPRPGLGLGYAWPCEAPGGYRHAGVGLGWELAWAGWD